MDIIKLKAEIESRKSVNTSREIALGNMPEGSLAKKPKRAFLNELVTSMHHGIQSEATETIRAVNETVEQRKGVPNAVAKNTGKYIPARPNQNYKANEQITVQPGNSSASEDWGIAVNGSQGVAVNGSQGGERDHLFESENAKFDQMMMRGNPVVNKLMKDTPFVNQGGQSQTPYMPQQMNEGVEVLSEKFERNMEKMVESTFKSVLTNIYTKERITEAVEDYLKSEKFLKAVGNAINEIAKRNKAKQGKL